MKKFLVADIVKAISEEDAKMLVNLIRDFKVDISQAKEMLNLMQQEKVNDSEAYYLTENWDSEAEYRDVMETADALNIGIEDVQDDDVESVMDGAGSKDEAESSIGIIQWFYDNKLKAYIVYIMLTDNSNPDKAPTDVLYRISPEMMKEWSDSSSMGEYYNNNIRGNISLEDPNISCGCGPNPCEQGQIDQFNQKFNQIKRVS
jgi:hypothetical protein